MIVACFDKGRTAMVSGAYQYDIGQRLVMHGLPSPQELAGRDDLLSGDLVTVQVQFSYQGDSQTDMRLAGWDGTRRVWLADVPDEYLTRNRDVHVYVFCYYGMDDIGERAETAYEAIFRPISRPAPGGMVTEGQLDQWAALKNEIEMAMARVESAAAAAEAAAGSADLAENRAAQEEEKALDAAQAAGDALDALDAVRTAVLRTQGSSSTLATGSPATARINLSGETGRLNIGAPRGAKGAKGETGDTGPADVTFAFDEKTGTLTVTIRDDTGEE